ncbi:MAG: glucodextranase DOMON-like domain-containing protein [Halanaerobium sp.]|nr:glucodextranase DOMON-like domain-containing protein [Halanaerobium sp.]
MGRFKPKFRNLFILILLILVLFAAGQAEARVIFFQEDPVGDENGPGDFLYPTHRHFDPYEGLFDLTSIKIEEEGDYYIFQLAFARITDPWQSRYGFSHPLIEIYIDNLDGGEVIPFRPGSGIVFSPRAPWDYLLKCTGWWVRGFTPADRREIAEGGIPWNAQENPWDIPGASAQVLDDGKTIEIVVPAEAFKVEGNIYVLIGSFDPFGPDHFRDIRPEAGAWEFGGAADGEYYPRTLDILVPQGKRQSSILSSYDREKENYARLEPVSIGSRNPSWLTRPFWILTIALIIAGAALLWRRRDIFFGE